MDFHHIQSSIAAQKIGLFEICAEDMLFARKAWRYIYPYSETALSDFYENDFVKKLTGQLPNYSKLILVGKQINYWNNIFSHGFDETYINDAIRIINVHQKLGISLSDYITSYAIMLQEFEDILRNERANDLCLAENLSGLRKVFFVDISIVCSLYTDVKPRPL
ncbi:protoglobin domain-containing protein [Roseibium sp.]|uniref:protoglobin domain-containing protein n=1 Tax=Roseibium sp. TaxID=1936156 RepID=UPI003B512B85